MFFSGFFVREKVVLAKSLTYVISFNPTAPSVLGSDRRHLKSFFPRAAGDLLHDALPLTARHGLVLVRLHSPDANYIRLAVCNLLVGACHMLPPLRCNLSFDKIGYAILTSADCSLNAKQQTLAPPPEYSAFFKVLIVGNNNLHKFTSGDTRWIGPKRFDFISEDYWNGCIQLNPRAIVCRGMAHWLVRSFGGNNLSWHTIDVDADTCCVSRTKIETPAVHDITHRYDEPQLTITAGSKLSMFRMERRGYQLEIWTHQKDGGHSKWIRTLVVELKPPSHHRSLMHLIMLGEKGGMLLVKDSHHNVYTASLETGEMKKVAGFHQISRRHIVPLEMDWPTFFVSRLGK
jgi:hypothetical protein